MNLGADASRARPLSSSRQRSRYAGNPNSVSRLDPGLGPRPRRARRARLARTARLGSRRGLASREPAIASAKSHRARRLTPLRLCHGTLDLAGPKHTPCLRRDARMVATSPPARVVTCVPLPLESPPTAIARATEPEPLGFLDRRADLRGDRAGPGAAREDARSGHRADYVLCHASGC